MMRKVYVTLTVSMILNVDEGESVDEALEEMDYGFTSTVDFADVVDTEITDWEITDSK